MRLARTSLSIWRAVCQTVKAMRCRSVSVCSRSGVISVSLKLLFAASCRVSPQRQQSARSQARDSESLLGLVIDARDHVRGFYASTRHLHALPLRRRFLVVERKSAESLISMMSSVRQTINWHLANCRPPSRRNETTMDEILSCDFSLSAIPCGIPESLCHNLTGITGV